MDTRTIDDLSADIKRALSSRYVEDRSSACGPYVRNESGLRFEELNWADRRDVLTNAPFWGWYDDQGMTQSEQMIVVGNVLDGKPKERWFEGVLDEAVLENEKIAGFKASVEDRENSPGNHVFEEMDGDRLPWADLSAAAKLQYIALDAVRHDVPFKPFSEVVKKTIGDVPEAALRVVLDGQIELHAIAELFPADGRTEPTPLVEQVKEMLDYVSALEAQQEERSQNREKPFEGISNDLDGRAPRTRMEDVKAFREILREERPMPEDVKSERDEDVRRDALAKARADGSPAKAEEAKLSLRDLRHGSEEQVRRGEDQRNTSREMER